MEDCKVLRPWDNYFWFFELHQIPEDKVEWPEFFGKPFPRAAVQMGARLGNNQFWLSPSNLAGGATIWLSPEFVDFKNKIKISGDDFKDFVQPSRRILLEDVRQRVDRKHPYWAKVEFRDRKWQVNAVEE